MPWLWVLLGYLLGGIPWAVFVVRLLRGVDVRSTGSGNVGARNSLRVGGPLAGALVLLLDALKAAVPTALVQLLEHSAWLAALVGVAALLGHCFSPYLIVRSLRWPWRGWRIASLRVGGMGLASGLGMICVLAPLVVLPTLLLGAAIIFGLKRPTGAAIAMIGVAPPLAWLLGYPAPALAALSAGALIILVKHLADLFPDPHGPPTLD